MTARRLRVGIDVGGTFTDVVAIDASTRRVVGRVKTPTTHTASEGVAAGIVAGLHALLRDGSVGAGDVAFVAHSTTQATNALLEGDVADVGVLGLSRPLNVVGRRRLRFARVPLAPGRDLAPPFVYASAANEAAIRDAIDRLIAGGANAIAISEAFGVDRPAAEAFAARYARQRGVEATSGHDVSSMYGLRARTRTAALNAAMLPKMLRTSRMTAAAVADSSIGVPLMVMRSDGGVMDVGEIERRPILTLLSGPAAGVAGALLYEHLSDGLFVEVGGTSSDCSAIRGGRPQMHPARIGGHRTMLQTIDVRTIGLGGGSMLRAGAGAIVDVGPRSAHLAGCAYACFSDCERVQSARVETISPVPGDPPDYAVLVTPDGDRIAPTLTCAANMLGAVPAGAFAGGDAASARAAFQLLGAALNAEAEDLARAVLDTAADKLRPTLEELIADYRLDPSHTVVVGGGGGAGAIVPYTAERMQLPFRIARDAEVIAPIGVALALVRDVVERTIVAPTAGDIARLRREAADRVIASGADPDRVEVTVEIDAQRNRVRAAAAGTTALVDTVAGELCDESQRREVAARSLNCDAVALERVPLSQSLDAYRHGRDWRVVDDRAAVRLAVRDATLHRTIARDVARTAVDAVEAATNFGDVGRALPALYVLRGGRIASFEGLTSAVQAGELAAEELSGCNPLESIAMLTVGREA